MKSAFADTISALEDISNYKQEALPRIKQTIAEFQELADTGNDYIARIEKMAPVAQIEGGEAPKQIEGEVAK